MIGFIRGKIVAKGHGTIVVEVNGIGYDIHLPGYVEHCLRDQPVGAIIELYTLYHHPEQQPRPKLFGFQNMLEREFFEELTRVKDLGPTKAMNIFASPVGKMAKAIADGDEQALRRIKGVGPQMAKKIIAELQQRAAKYALLPQDVEEVSAAGLDEVRREVFAVLTDQLGHSRAEALRMIEEALKRNPGIREAEQLFEEVYRGERAET